MKIDIVEGFLLVNSIPDFNDPFNGRWSYVKGSAIVAIEERISSPEISVVDLHMLNSATVSVRAEMHAILSAIAESYKQARSR